MVPRLFPDATLVCLGSGPSLTAADLQTVHAACRTDGRHIRSLAINTTYKSAPWADVLYAPDLKWWSWHPDAVQFQGFKFALGPRHAPGVTGLEWTGREGIEDDPHAVRTGGHSGYAAINLAMHLGARRIVLLGYDLDQSADGHHHHHDEHPDESHPRYEHRRAVYATCLEPLAKKGIAILNASRHTTIEAIPRATLAEALS
jgi:hypothetical protein